MTVPNYSHWAALTVAIATTSGMPSLAAAQPESHAAAEGVRRAGEALIADINWPDDDSDFGFKWLSIGAPFDLSGPTVIAHTRRDHFFSYRDRPISCKLIEPAPVMECQKFGGDTAFGDLVTVSFEVVLDVAPTREQIEKAQFGTGRIATVFLTNDNPSENFISSATSHFTSLAGREPVTRRNFRNPTSAYSEECLALVKRVRSTPAIELTKDDLAQEALCERQALMTVMSGSTRTGWTTYAKWDEVMKHYQARVAATEFSTVVNGMTSPKTEKVVLTLNLNYDEALANFNANLATEKAKSDATDAQMDLKDF